MSKYLYRNIGATLDHKNQEIVRLEAKVDQLEAENEALVTRSLSVERQLEFVDKRAQRLTDQVSELESENETFKLKIAAIKQNISDPADRQHEV